MPARLEVVMWDMFPTASGCELTTGWESLSLLDRSSEVLWIVAVAGT